MGETALISYPDNRQPVDSVGLGVFDGIHKGHQEIISRCDAVMTFSPHPDEILRKSATVKRLTTVDEQRFYIDQLYVLHFNRDIAQMGPEDFLNRILLERIRPKRVVVGYDYHFGRRQSGNVALLRQWGEAHGITVEEVPPKTVGQVVVKSALIRTKMRNNLFAEAIDLLGHPYLVRGTVVQGDGRGKALGFPTANLRLPEEKLLPDPGIYGGFVLLGGEKRMCIVYIGHKPTFGEQPLQMEVHIPDFDGDLYGNMLNVFLTEYIRPDRRFDSEASLVKQIRDDLSVMHQRYAAKLH